MTYKCTCMDEDSMQCYVEGLLKELTAAEAIIENVYRETEKELKISQKTKNAVKKYMERKQ